ncbi:MAG: hypothetical protein KatS3mg099_176 [Candidatus Parcubacteria bacterium]|nr:MAG: hypothetical protein KatS3mg099_176 [Candidatus Parcubacteria bacterium]
MTHTHLTLVQRRRIYSLGLAGFAAVAVCIATLAVFAQSAYAQDTTAEGEAGVSANAQNDPVSIEIEASGEVMPSPQKPHRPVPMPPSRGDRPVHKPGDDEARAVSPRDRSPTPPPSSPAQRERQMWFLLPKSKGWKTPKRKLMSGLKNAGKKRKSDLKSVKKRRKLRLEARKEQILERVHAMNGSLDMFRRVKERLEAAVARLEKLADKLERRISRVGGTVSRSRLRRVGRAREAREKRATQSRKPEQWLLR